jgi:2-oxo-4-hydroxy-4-carboxy--5-ureidoimidazoline (OHCU) decarboxylase
VPKGELTNKYKSARAGTGAFTEKTFVKLNAGYTGWIGFPHILSCRGKE